MSEPPISAEGDAPTKPARRPVAAALIVLVGLLIGLGLGLFYAWVLAPVEFVDTTPAELNDAQQERYLLLIADAYAAEGDLARAEARLATLQLPDATNEVATLLDLAVAAQAPPEVVRHLALLARDLGVRSNAVAAFAPANVAPPAPAATPTSAVAALPATEPTTPASTPTPLPDDPAQPTIVLLGREPLCVAGQDVARIEVRVVDGLNVGLAGMEIEVVWPGGRDRFVTGLKPDEGPGYADFTMTEGVVYTLSLPAGSARIRDLQTAECDDGHLGGWQLTFQNDNTFATQTPEAAEA